MQDTNAILQFNVVSTLKIKNLEMNLILVIEFI